MSENKKSFRKMTREDWEHMTDISYSDCVVCGKPTTREFFNPFFGSIPCHDSCLEGLIKLYPNRFRKVIKNE